MKYKITLLVILFPVFIQAQSVSRLDTLAANVMQELKASWTFGLDNSNKSVDIRTFNKFKALFDLNATVDDDYNYQFIPGDTSGTYIIKIISKPFDEYAHDVALEISKLKIGHANTKDSIGNWENNSLIVKTERNILAEKARKFLLQDIDGITKNIMQFHREIEFSSKKTKRDDSLQMVAHLKKMILNNPDSVYRFSSTSTLYIRLIKINDSTIRIGSIRSAGKSFNLICLNDRDGDGVLNGEDSTKKIHGDFTAHGLPDYDFDGVPDSEDKCDHTFAESIKNQGCPDSYFITSNQTDGFIGVQFNLADISLPELNQLHYRDESGIDAMDVLQSKKGILQNPGIVPGIVFGGNFSYYFGQNGKNAGISIGFTYSGFKAVYQLTEPMVYTYKSSDGTNYYRRQVSINALREEIKYNIYNIPVLFSYRFKPGFIGGNKLVINLKAGPSLMLFNNSTDYNAIIDFGGLYQVDSIGKDAITYYDHFDQNSKWNILLTSENINTQNPNPGGANVFFQLNSASANYDFASNKNYLDIKKLTRTTIAINIGCDLQYNFAKGKDPENGFAVQLGAHLVYVPTYGKNKEYVPIDKTTDEYNSIYNSSAKSIYSAIGVNLGFVYRF